jgi:hypothetical protein
MVDMDLRTRRPGWGWGWWALALLGVALAVYVAHERIQKARAVRDLAIIKAEEQREIAHLRKALELCHAYARADKTVRLACPTAGGNTRGVSEWAVKAGLGALEDFRSTRDGQYYHWLPPDFGSSGYIEELVGKSGTICVVYANGLERAEAVRRSTSGE